AECASMGPLTFVSGCTEGIAHLAELAGASMGPLTFVSGCVVARHRREICRQGFNGAAHVRERMQVERVSGYEAYVASMGPLTFVSGCRSFAPVERFTAAASMGPLTFVSGCSLARACGATAFRRFNGA